MAYHQTQEDMDSDLAILKDLISEYKWRADRCRHESVITASLWVFDGDKQVGSITRLNNNYEFKVNYIVNGMPHSEFRAVGLYEAISHLRYWHNKFK